MNLSTVVILTQGNFATQALHSSLPVLVYFWAEWCGPCKTIAPVLDELADEYGDRARIGKVNIDEQPALAAQYGIRAIPALVLLRQGQIADQMVGLRNKWELKNGFDQVLG